MKVDCTFELTERRLLRLLMLSELSAEMDFYKPVSDILDI